MPIDTIATLTVKAFDELVARTGSGDWKLDPVNARKATYLVCCRNANSPKTRGPEAHGTAFFLGRISEIRKLDQSDRYLIMFDKFSKINIPRAWEKIGSPRNPIRYTSLKSLGIDVANLSLAPVGTDEPQQADSFRGPGISIKEAKRMLGVSFGVPPESIEIIIRG